MTNEDAVKWMENLKSDIGKMQFRALWGYEQAMDEIIDLLSVETKWTPVSEGLPKDDEDVIVSVLDDYGDTPWKYTTVAWLCNGTWISDNDILCGTVIAWMSKPKPYREEDDE